MDKIIRKYFPDLDQDQQVKIAQLGELYNHWNSKLNLISRKDMDHFYERHVLHSLGIAKVCNFNAGCSIVDVGTGGGFPGIPLAIVYPEANFHLVDSIAKKIRAVDEIVAALGLKNVTTQQSRIEDIKHQFDYSVSRAVARMVSFYQWVQPQIKPGGTMLYLKGGDIEGEMKELNKPYKVYELQDFFKEEFFTTKKVVRVEV